MDMSLSRLWELVMDRHAAAHGIAKSQTPLSDWTSLEAMGISSQWLMGAAEGFPMSMAEARGEKLFLGVLGVGIQKRVSSWWEELSEIKEEEKGIK